MRPAPAGADVAVTRTPARSPIRLVAAVLAILLVPIASCSPAGRSAPGQVMVGTIRTAITEPVWSPRTHAIYALTEDGSAISRVRPPRPGDGPGAWRQDTSSMPGLGRNLVADADGDDNLYVPLPGRGRIAVVSESSLRKVRTMPGGTEPSYVATDSGSAHLLVLGRDGSAVTPVDLHTRTARPAHRVAAGSDAELDGAKRGRRIDFYVSDPSGIAHYKWKLGRIRMDGSLPIRAGETAGDLTKPSRLYVAEDGGSRLVAVDLNRGGTGLREVASTRLNGPIEYLGVDEARLYAATDDRLYVLATSSFEGFPDGRFTVLDTVDYRSALRGDDRTAPLGGLVVGGDRVYLTLSGVPTILSIRKPSL